MGWRAAATFLGFAVFLVSLSRASASVARSPLQILGVGVIAGIVAVAGIGALNLTAAAADTASGFLVSAL